MKFEHLQGSIVAMVTPFRQDGSVNFDMLTELLERQIAAGTDGILTLGTTGEYSTMSHEEDAAVVEHTIRVVDGRVPVMVGSGSNCTVTQIEKSRLYQSMGADALLLISPYYNKANAEGMYRHFAETADAVDIPCILYNVPGRTGCSIPVSVVERLARHPNIAGIKEASGDMSYAMKIARCVGPDFALYSGNDDITVPILSIGGSGVISVYANVMPAMCRQIVADWLDGNHARALENHLRYLQLMNDLFLEVNPIPVKAAMNMMGLDVGPMRLPLCEMGEGQRRHTPPDAGGGGTAVRIILIGRGKMGTLIRETAAAAGDEIEAVFGRDDLGQLGRLGRVADVVMDFSRPEALPEVASYVRRTGTPLLSGTTGYTEAEKGSLFALGSAAPVLWSANYSLGVAVLARALQVIAPVLGPDFDIEITETHHSQKADAPSGTAKLLLEAVDPQHRLRPVYGREGNCGRREKDEVGIHALRGGTVAGTHTVHFFGPDEELELTHRAASRQIFVNGALHIARLLPGRPKGVYDLQKILFGA